MFIVKGIEEASSKIHGLRIKAWPSLLLNHFQGFHFVGVERLYKGILRVVHLVVDGRPRLAQDVAVVEFVGDNAWENITSIN